LKVDPEGKKGVIDVLVEEPFHKIAESHTEGSSMPEEKTTKGFELWYSIV
jgi:hypothetical protein